MKSLSKKQMDDMMLMGGVEYARQEAWDIQNAAQVLSQLAYMCINECDEPQDVKELCGIMRSLLAFIEGEMSEMEKAARRGEGYEKSVPAQVESFAVPKDKELNLSYVKSLGTAIDAQNIAVKYLSRNEIKGYTFLWGDPEKKLIDVEIEYFTKDSNFWDKALSKNPRPLTWDHAQDESFKASPIIGEIVDFGDDDLGRWYVAKLDTAHRYKEVINQLIKDGVLGTSSDSAPQYVTRSKRYDGDWFDQQSNGTWKSDSGKVVKSIRGATWLKQWPWFASALTNVPAEPRMVDSLEFLKSLGVQLPEVALSQRQRYEHLKRQSEILKLKEKVG